MIKIITSTLLGLAVATGGALASDGAATDYFAGETPLSDGQLSEARGGVGFTFEFGTLPSIGSDLNIIIDGVVTITDETLGTANAASDFANIARFDPVLEQFIFVNAQNNVSINQAFVAEVTIRNFDQVINFQSAARITADTVLNLATIRSPF